MSLKEFVVIILLFLSKLVEVAEAGIADNADPAEGGGDIDSNDDEDEQDDNEEQGEIAVSVENDAGFDFRRLGKSKRKGFRLIDVVQFFFSGVEFMACDPSLSSNSL